MGWGVGGLVVVVEMGRASVTPGRYGAGLGRARRLEVGVRCSGMDRAHGNRGGSRVGRMRAEVGLGAMCGLMVGLMGVVVASGGCATPPIDPLAGLAPAGAQSGTPAYVGESAIGWDTLQPLLAERGGAEVLDEVALTLAARAEAAARGIELSASEVERERVLALEALAPGGSGAERERLADRVLRARGLGPVRFALLIERSALLRAMVRDGVEVTEQDLATARGALAGERRVARVIATRTWDEAAELRDEVERAEDRRAAFIELAIAHSTDPTAPRGGLTEPIGLDDPAYPPEIRRVLAELAPGELSGVLAVERGFVVLLGERQQEGVGTPAEPDDLVARVRLAKERLAMDRLAAELRAGARVRVLDPALRWSSEGR